MWLVYFSFGLLVGLIFLFFYVKVEKKRWKEKINKDQTIFRLAEGSTDVFYHYEVEPNTRFTYISPSLEKYLGKGAIEEAMVNSYAPFERVHPDDYEILHKKITGELNYNNSLVQRWKDNEGRYRWFEEYTTPIYDHGRLVAIQGIMRNIDEKIKLQQDLEYRINHDSLTGIYNRDYFESKFIKLDGIENTSVAILVCDLDDLKATNDTYGHKQGDALIINTAWVLQEFSSEDVTVARLGGDEFVLLVTGKTKGESKHLVTSILNKINEYNASPSNIEIKLSIGCAFSQNSNGQMTKLYAQADKNMYFNKKQRKQLICVK